MWTIKYAPRNSGEVIGQDVVRLKDFVINFKSQKKKALLIYGPIGCGKTSSVYAIANELSMEILELNASDFRSTDQINSIIGANMKQQSLFNRKKLILIDELDGIAGREDRGGLNALVKLIPKTSFPVVLIANDPFDKKFNSLRKLSILLEFKALSSGDVVKILKKINSAENLGVSDEELMSIARSSGGDARAAIIDLQLAGTGKKIGYEDLGLRSQEESMPQALVKVLKISDPLIARDAFVNVKEDLDQQFLWVDENMPKEYTKPSDLERAYHYIAEADVYRGRIRKWQHWGFLVYVNAFLTAGVAVSKDEKYKHLVKYMPTMRLLKIWQANMRLKLRKSIAQKIARHTHCSAKEALLISYLYGRIIKQYKEVVDELELTDEEVKFLKKTS